MGIHGEPSPGSGDPRLGIDDDAGRAHPLRLQERQNGQQRSRRVTPGIAHHPGPADLAPAKLGQSVDGLVQQTRRPVGGAVPLFVHLWVFESEVGAQIHDPGVLEHRRREFHRLARGKGKEHHIGITRHTSRVAGCGGG